MSADSGVMRREDEGDSSFKSSEMIRHSGGGTISSASTFSMLNSEDKSRENS